MKKGKKKQNLKIKPMIYSLMEIRKMDYLQRNGLPIPQELLDRKKAEDERQAKEVAIKNVIEHKTELPKINEEDERIYPNKENNNKELDEIADENVRFSSEQKLVLNGNQFNPTPVPEQEKVSLIKIGVSPKLQTPPSNTSVPITSAPLSSAPNTKKANTLKQGTQKKK